MPLLVNRCPVSDEMLAMLLAYCDLPEHVSGTLRGPSAIAAEELEPEGQLLMRALLVEGEPAGGITLRSTRWGRRWCAYRTVE